ncbi:hypothetical protein A2962_05180 [Candidatus Woesebacteria bacterium RIFCSPLOWO2_01_FULL_39_61]|uniref:DUF2795 domain-containing protein n=1 Tax=Candidatus Woesebacteria bacterium RIFCSPHIGHO2_02_FULL_39_13 TaxID=1802505 RepID=A0A1F7Z0S6_9BACT|nr:MAG: hypothetical protein A3D01_01670 [Candidatus Woesebacteria bacterium RIFCSPHIGHO2_02_FULL_39_13]OGM39115.1 MAG: hypothetical protein A3E13_01730 [Candidatus Woesebacteria bacterium RIFCSPHIGHO2_12_FULL_40_20]OGM68690.1 MAG: hypothetical protein A2962_05180 [Candidatus Woesebacteria bacterium RIFCSPLOWO2_01_FULL_39_61]OGM74686.1 MAG: hypothetical protein A3H19_05385 [Candidatus Woesebacteria bacterium RIFCSPLOWO2_12_FULL_39_9]
MQNKSGAVDHLKTHQKYPATKAELLKECDGLSDFSDEDKEWFAAHLAQENYESAEDVMKDLGLEEAQE